MTTSGGPRWLDAEEDEAWRAYLLGSRSLEAALDRDLAGQGIGLSEYELLSMLSEAPGERMRMSTLADLVVQSRSRVTHTAARLEGRGWVTREQCLADRRGVELVLTDSGRNAIRRMATIHVDSVRAHLLDLVTREELLALGRAMSRVREAGCAEARAAGLLADGDSA